MENIQQIAARYKPGTVPDAGLTNTFAPARNFAPTPLNDFRFHHLNEQWMVQRLRRALEKATEWQRCQRTQPIAGLSLVLTGSLGTGKTTIAHNLMSVFNQTAVVEGMSGETVTVARCRMFDATGLMKIVAERGDFTNTLRREKCFVIDDLGTEDFGTETYTPSTEQITSARQHRYGRFIDWCYRSGKSVIITSNVPLVTRDEGDVTVNAEFVNIIGARSWDRLLQMAGGYMIDLTGLPSYRPEILKGVF